MTASRSPISSATSTSTTRRTARTTATAPTTTTASIAASRGRPTTRPFWRCAGSLRRNQLASLLLAQGVPLILAGDEVGNSQGGNNNAYCQDDEIGWVDWSKLGSDDDMTEFVGDLTRLRQRFPQLRPRHWLEGRKADGSYDVQWLTPDGDRDDRGGLEFPGRPLSLLCARRPRRRRRAAASSCSTAPTAVELTAAAMAGRRALAPRARHRGEWQTEAAELAPRQQTGMRRRARVLAFAGKP